MLKYHFLDSEIATSVAWAPDGQLFSCSDDKDVKKWGSDGSCQGKVTSLSAFPSCVSWYPSNGKQASYYQMSNHYFSEGVGRK